MSRSSFLLINKLLSIIFLNSSSDLFMFLNIIEASFKLPSNFMCTWSTWWSPFYSLCFSLCETFIRLNFGYAFLGFSTFFYLIKISFSEIIIFFSESTIWSSSTKDCLTERISFLGDGDSFFCSTNFFWGKDSFFFGDFFFYLLKSGVFSGLFYFFTSIFTSLFSSNLTIFCY